MEKDCNHIISITESRMLVAIWASLSPAMEFSCCSTLRVYSIVLEPDPELSSREEGVLVAMSDGHSRGKQVSEVLHVQG